jgi:sec-independent protein translocase protein TatA
MTHLILFSLGAPELILIIAVVLLLFGGKKIPELMRGLGQGVKEFKKAAREGDQPEEPKENKAEPKG